MNRQLSALHACLPCLLIGLWACGSDPVPELGIIQDKGSASFVLPPFDKIVRPVDAVPAGPFTCNLTAGTDSMGATKVVTLNDENDYTFRNVLTISNTKVKPLSNLNFEWSGVSTSFLQQPVNPKIDIGALLIAMFRWPHAELASRLGSDQVGDNDALNVITIFTQEPNQKTDEPKTPEGFTEHDLYKDVNFNHVPVEKSMVDSNLNPDPTTGWDPATNTWAVLLQKGTEIPAPAGVVQMIATFTLDPSSSNTTVKIDDQSTVLQHDTMLQQWHPVLVPQDLSSVAFQWSSLTKNGMGVPLSGALGIRKLFIAHYKETPAELEEQFLKLDTPNFALEEYTNSTQLAFSEGSARLTEFVTKDGKAFSGLTADGTWLVGINCDVCKSPAPSYLGVLKSCSGG